MAIEIVKNGKSWWKDLVFYCAIALLIASLFSYGIFYYKAHLLNQKVGELDDKIAVYGTKEQKDYEKEVLDYKKKIDDFSTIIASHKISSNVFSFMEASTLPEVWFLSFDMSQPTNEIRLLGETDSMETLSRQVQIFEKNRDYVKNITVLNTQLGSLGKVTFNLNLSLEPKIFDYVSKTITNAPESEANVANVELSSQPYVDEQENFSIKDSLQ